jgi:hypothetical protein
MECVAGLCGWLWIQREEPGACRILGRGEEVQSEGLLGGGCELSY